MSTLAATNLKHASSASNNIVLDSSGNATFAGTPVPNSSFLRNRIINGDMRIDQRNAGASISVTATGFPVDRFYINANSTGVISGQRSTVAPAGFTNSLLMTVTTPRGTIAANDVYGVRQTLEGFNTADLMWGSASAQTVTLSFWVRSSITGTYTVSLFNAAFNRSYVATYTVNAANTFEYKTVVVPGDTTGTWATDNTASINVFWDVGSGSDFQATANTWVAAGDLRTSGSTNWISTNGATFYLTGVQLEVGTAATPFERRQYGQELALCQRYYEQFGPGYRVNLTTAANMGTTTSAGPFRWRVQKRTAPTVTVSGGWRTLGANQGASVSISFGELSNESASISGSVGSGYTQGQSNLIQSTDGDTSYVQVSAEL
jgi:hypothetical protein